MAPTPLSWQALRSAAEGAHGLQSQDVGIRLEDDKLVVEPFRLGADYIFTVAKRTLKQKTRTIAVQLPGVDMQRLRDRGINIPANGDIFAHADAVFWTQSAVEKFLIPYYSSYVALEHVMQEIRDKFMEENVVAYIHLPNSEVVDDSWLHDEPSTAITATLFAVVESDSPAGPAFGLQPII